MARGRPKVAIAPCRYCSKRFKRTEHLVRHERTHTREKPFACSCGQKFARQDLLAQHSRVSHPSGPSTSPAGRDAAGGRRAHDDIETCIDTGSFWNFNFATPDMLLAEQFDSSFPFSDLLPCSQPPPATNFSQFSSRLPRLDDADDDTQHDVEELTSANPGPWVITEHEYERLRIDIQSHSAVLPPSCSLPSRNNLMQDLQKYLTDVHEVLSFIHVATFAVDQKATELLLAMAALGALYRYERSKSRELYFMAKAIFLENMRRDQSQHIPEFFGQGNINRNLQNDIGRMQTFVLLFLFASWGDKTVSFDALSLSSQLAMLARDNGISEADRMPEHVEWLSWVAIEEKRRTLFAAYALFNLHSLAFSIPPLILNYEVGIFLPGYIDQWRSRNATEWHRTPRQSEFQFQETLRSLEDGSRPSQVAAVSSFANYLLIHGILQQIYVNRQGSSGPLSSETVERFNTILQTWQSSWETSYESTLDPSCPKGPFGLNAAALLRICYISLISDLGPCRGLLSRDLHCLDVKRPSPCRSPVVDRAVLHAAHALSIPVRLGIAYMACTRSSIWTIEHSLSGFRCALMLYDWLLMISVTAGSASQDGLRRAETRLIGIITGIIKETDFAYTLDILEDEACRYRRMAGTVIKLWASAFQGIHMFEVDNALGTALRVMVDLNDTNLD